MTPNEQEQANEAGETTPSTGASGCCTIPVDHAAGAAAASAWQSAPLGCTGSPEEVAEIARLLASLASDSSAPPQRTAAGYALRLPRSPELERRAGEFIRRDKVCCPFLEFELDRDGGDLRLEVSGPEGAQMVLNLSFELCRLAARQGSSS
jgi:hypothetical protein